MVSQGHQFLPSTDIGRLDEEKTSPRGRLLQNVSKLVDSLLCIVLGSVGAGKILGGPTAVFGAKKLQIEGFQKGVNDEKLLGSACVSGG
ncbi:hypothetical protein TNCV_3196071 [Trichonephila clavipes]|nr:hypothetical protein TNCV_3196071 [Trichonephila clavipes]